VSTFAKTEQLLVGYRGFGSLHPWPSAQYRAYCLPALFLAGDSSGRSGPSDGLQSRHSLVLTAFNLKRVENLKIKDVYFKAIRRYLARLKAFSSLNLIWS